MGIQMMNYDATFTWIDVSDGLPPRQEFVDENGNKRLSDASVIVMATDGKHHYITAYDYMFEQWWAEFDSLVDGMKITHWGYLPELPGEAQ